MHADVKDELVSRLRALVRATTVSIEASFALIQVHVLVLWAVL